MINRLAVACCLGLALSGCDSVQKISSPSGSTVDVAMGSFSIALRKSPAVSEEYAYSWGEAQVTGSAVKFDHTAPEPDTGNAPGSAGGIVYFFKAVGAGESDIVIRRKPGPKAEGGPDYQLHVRVK